ncbi:hypothetical protein [Cecembia calidifontis]|uniref:YolD-like protein n=1 Tax=Cecembia calidifontis TaxID=1187080 RepID=A0A4Q7P5Y0_9BACT|nr:hypothetical protein [Cecembia calidifontis]RZS94860.1 hypothetical protein BC751_0371 [Cecembia calidifontis]
MERDFILTQKEHIGVLYFPKEEVLDSEMDREARKAALNRALSLGNLEQIKVQIYFTDSEKSYLVDTTIWGLTEERVILKQGITIPINRIISVSL